MGRVRVEDAHGAPPNIPFWRGEAPSRTADLSAEVADVTQRRLHVDKLTQTRSSSAVQWLKQECGLDAAWGPAGRRVRAERARPCLGTVPTQATIVAERFFDESGGMQLGHPCAVRRPHQRAWGLAFESASVSPLISNSRRRRRTKVLVISLGERHSFPLESVFGVSCIRKQSGRCCCMPCCSADVRDTLALERHASAGAAALLGGKKCPRRFSACRPRICWRPSSPMRSPARTISRADRDDRYRTIRSSQETMRDCLTEAMDVEGLDHGAGENRDRVRFAVSPSIRRCRPRSRHEILNANPYAYLDDAPLGGTPGTGRGNASDLARWNWPAGRARWIQSAIDEVVEGILAGRA